MDVVETIACAVTCANTLYVTNLTHSLSCMFIFILYMFRPAMCPSPGELLYQCDTWFMSLCVDDRLVCRSICSCIPDGHLNIRETFCVRLVIYKDRTKMAGQQKIKFVLIPLKIESRMVLACGRGISQLIPYVQNWMLYRQRL